MNHWVVVKKPLGNLGIAPFFPQSLRKALARFYPVPELEHPPSGAAMELVINQKDSEKGLAFSAGKYVMGIHHTCHARSTRVVSARSHAASRQ